VQEPITKKGVLIKFGELEHLRQLQHGLLYCNSLDYFSKLEKENPAADSYENVTELKDLSGGTFEFWPAEFPKPEHPLSLTPEWSQWATRNGHLGNIFCLYFLDADQLDRTKGYQIDVRNGRKDNCFLIIEQIQTFQRRIIDQADKQGIKWRMGFVRYVNLKKYSGPKDVFQKDLRFDHEKEWRTHFLNPRDSPLQLQIGSISDITMLCCGRLDKCELFLQDGGRIGMSNCRVLDD
jgi:hypothetical protein